MSIDYYLFETYMGGFTLVALGFFAIFYTKKYPSKKDFWFQADTKGVVAGIGFILLGLTIILAKFIGKL